MKDIYNMKILSTLEAIRAIMENRQQEVPWKSETPSPGSALTAIEFRDIIFFRLEERSTWGRNQIKAMLTDIISN